jgi:hypothetical protein
VDLLRRFGELKPMRDHQIVAVAGMGGQRLFDLGGRSVLADRHLDVGHFFWAALTPLSAAQSQSPRPQRSTERGPLRRSWRSLTIPRMHGWGGRIRTSVWRNQNPPTFAAMTCREYYDGTEI